MAKFLDMKLNQITDGQIEQLFSVNLIVHKIMAVRVNARIQTPQPMGYLFTAPIKHIYVCHFNYDIVRFTNSFSPLFLLLKKSRPKLFTLWEVEFYFLTFHWSSENYTHLPFATSSDDVRGVRCWNYRGDFNGTCVFSWMSTNSVGLPPSQNMNKWVKYFRNKRSLISLRFEKILQFAIVALK